MEKKLEEQVKERPPKQKRCFRVNKNLVTLKLTLFFLYGATSSLMPYLTIHMQSIGLTIEEIAIIYLALPFTTFLAPPVTGFLVDKFGHYKPVIIISFALNAGIHHLLLLMPHQEIPGTLPSGYIIRDPSNGNAEVWWSPCTSRQCPEQEEIDVVLDMCVDHCLLKHPPLLAVNKPQLDVGDEDDLKFHLGKTKTNHTKINRKLKKPSKTKKIFENDTAVTFVLDMHRDLAEPVENFGIEVQQVEVDVTNFIDRFSEELFIEAGVNLTELEESDLRCGGLVLKATTSHNAPLKDLPGKCVVQKCNFRQGGPHVCPPEYKESDDRTFWIYFVLRFSGSIMLSAGITIMDPVALTMIEKFGGDFGREKLFSSLGMALFSPITGALIDFNSRRLGYTDYSAAFYTYDILLAIAAVTVYLMPLGTKLPADNIFRDLLNIFKIPNIVAFIIFLFILGNLWGFIESFLFFYLKELGAENYLLGITVTVGTISSMPFLYSAEKITKKIGHVNVIIVAFFAHAARLMGYSFIESAWWCFPFEAMESVSVHLMWVAAATYCAILAPKSLLATLIGVLGMAHFSIGRGSGSFVGGQLIGQVGIREAFRIMGLVAVIAGVLYGLLHYFWLRKYKIISQDDDIIDQEENGKLKDNAEPKYKDQSTMVSFERLSIMTEYNPIGSLTSLGRTSYHSILAHRNNSIRRGSYSIGMFKTSQGSASKVDLLKSAIEVNARNSTQNLKKSSSITSRQGINSNKAENKMPSNPKLNQKSSSLTPVVDYEVDKTLIPDEVEEIMYGNSKVAENTNNP